MSNYEVLSIICVGVTAIIALLAGIIAYVEYKKGVKDKKFNIVYNLLKKIRDDEYIPLIFDQIDRNNCLAFDKVFKLSDKSNGILKLESKIEESKLNAKIDSFLSVLNIVCYLWKNRSVTKDEIKIFDYYFYVVSTNECLCNYLYSLRLYVIRKNKAEIDKVKCVNPLEYLIEYFVEFNYLDKSFISEQDTKYKYILEDD